MTKKEREEEAERLALIKQKNERAKARENPKPKNNDTKPQSSKLFAALTTENKTTKAAEASSKVEKQIAKPKAQVKEQIKAGSSSVSAQSTNKTVKQKPVLEKRPPQQMTSQRPAPALEKKIIPQGKYRPDQRNDRPSAVKRRIEDSDEYSEEEEYDSDLDSFIDDEEPEPNVSSFIKEIFGYDKSK